MDPTGPLTPEEIEALAAHYRAALDILKLACARIEDREQAEMCYRS